MNAQKVTAYRCEACGELSEEADPNPLYECPECGTVFNRSNSADGSSHRCPEDNRFGRKVGDESCSECEEGPVEKVEAFRCSNCEELHETEEEANKCCQEGEASQTRVQKVDPSHPVALRKGKHYLLAHDYPTMQVRGGMVYAEDIDHIEVVYVFPYPDGTPGIALQFWYKQEAGGGAKTIVMPLAGAAGHFLGKE